MLTLKKYQLFVWFSNLTELYPVFSFAQFGKPNLEQSKKESSLSCTSAFLCRSLLFSLLAVCFLHMAGNSELQSLIPQALPSVNLIRMLYGSKLKNPGQDSK